MLYFRLGSNIYILKIYLLVLFRAKICNTGVLEIVIKNGEKKHLYLFIKLILKRVGCCSLICREHLPWQGNVTPANHLSATGRNKWEGIDMDFMNDIFYNNDILQK